MPKFHRNFNWLPRIFTQAGSEPISPTEMSPEIMGTFDLFGSSGYATEKGEGLKSGVGGGNVDVNSPEVPEGKVWLVTHAQVYHDDGAATREIQFMLKGIFGNFRGTHGEVIVALTARATLITQQELPLVRVPFIMRPGSKLSGRAFALAVGKAVYIDWIYMELPLGETAYAPGAG